MPKEYRIAYLEDRDQAALVMSQSELEFLPKAISIYGKGEIMETKRRRFTAADKVAILRQHLLEQVPISDLCDQHGIQASQYYVWQKQFFEKGTAAFERQQDATTPLKRRVAKLEAKLSNKNEVIAELLEVVDANHPLMRQDGHARDGRWSLGQQCL